MVGGGGGGGGAPSKLKRAARKIVQTCASFSRRKSHVLDTSMSSNSSTHKPSPPPTPPPKPRRNISDKIAEMAAEAESSTTTSTKNLCAICLDPLSYSTGSSPGQAIFTAQCSHAFHFACISSNVRHGGVTCPICRAHWSQLPRNLNTPSCYANQTDPILQILDHSIATFRVHRRSFLRSARYNDDDPIDPDHTVNHPRLRLTLSSGPLTNPPCSHQTTRPNLCHLCGVSSSQHHTNSTPSQLFQHFGQNRPYVCVSNSNSHSHSHSTNSNRGGGAYHLCVKLTHQPATDLVLVASPNGPHLRLIKQSMALVVFSLRPIDRLAIVTYSSAAARIFPLRRMTSYGKRTALQVIDRLFYMGQADPIEGLKKGVKILGDRSHENPHSCILHLSDTPTRSFDMELATTPIYRFNVGGFGFGTNSNGGLVMHEFEEFLTRVLGGAIRDIQLRIRGEDAAIVRLGELRGGEERRIPLNLGECGHVCVDYSYVDVDDECVQSGEIVVGIGGGDKRETSEGLEEAAAAAVAVSSVGGRSSSSVGGWDYHDPFMARRWAKHLHGYRL